MSLNAAQRALLDAVKRQSLEDVELQINAGVSVNFYDDDALTPLHHAARQQTPMIIVRALLDAGANPNMPDEKGFTPFMEAVAERKFPMATEMIDAGADISYQEKPGSITPLHAAIFSDNRQDKSECTAFMLERGGDLEKKMLRDGQELTPIELALKLEGDSRKFTALFEMYFNRDIKAEAAKNKAVLETAHGVLEKIQGAKRCKVLFKP